MQDFDSVNVLCTLSLNTASKAKASHLSTRCIFRKWLTGINTEITRSIL